MNDEILDVMQFAKCGDGDWLVICPHCGGPLGLEPGPVRGEQYQDKVCGGWLQVSFDAVRVKADKLLEGK